MNLSYHALAGELYFLKPYSMHGRIALDGWDMPLSLELVGRTAPDLAGCALRFEVKPERRAFYGKPEELLLDRKAIHPQQIGVTGHMSADGWVRVFDCTDVEFYRRAKLGERPPTQWMRRLYLEWYGQNGRMVIEVPDPILEISVAEDWLPMPPPDTPMPGDPDAEPEPDSAPEIKLVRFYGSKYVSRDITPKAGGENTDEEFTREMELMDRLLEEGEGEPLLDIFGAPRRLPREEDMNDEELESILKSILIQLAMANVAVDVCEHYGPRKLYRWLLEEILIEGRFHPEMIGSGWVQHYPTGESCPECMAAAEASDEAT